jgi:hypothetical protein
MQYRERYLRGDFEGTGGPAGPNDPQDEDFAVSAYHQLAIDSKGFQIVTKTPKAPRPKPPPVPLLECPMTSTAQVSCSNEFSIDLKLILVAFSSGNSSSFGTSKETPSLCGLSRCWRERYVLKNDNRFESNC